MLLTFIARFSMSIFISQAIDAAGTVVNPLGQLFVSPQESIICCRDIGERILKTFKPDIETFKDWNSFSNHVLSDDYLAVSQVNRYCNDELRYSFDKCWHYLCDRLYPEVRLAYFPRERLSESERSYCDALQAAVTERSEEKVALFKQAVVEHNMWKSTVFLFDLEGRYYSIRYKYRYSYSIEVPLRQKLLTANKANDYLIKKIIDRFAIFDIMQGREGAFAHNSSHIAYCCEEMNQLFDTIDCPYFQYYEKQLKTTSTFYDCFNIDLSDDRKNKCIQILTANLCKTYDLLQEAEEHYWFDNALAFVVLSNLNDRFFGPLMRYREGDARHKVFFDTLSTLQSNLPLILICNKVMLYENMLLMGNLSDKIYMNFVEKRIAFGLWSLLYDDGVDINQSEYFRLTIKRLVSNNPTRLLWHILYMMSDKVSFRSEYYENQGMNPSKMKCLHDILHMMFDMYRDEIVKTLSMRTLQFYEASESSQIVQKDPNVYQKAPFAEQLVSYIREHHGEIDGSVLIQMLDTYRNDLHKSRRRWINVAATALFAYGIGNDLYQVYKKK